MIRCVFGYCTNGKDDFVVHPVNELDDLRKAYHFIKKIHKTIVRSRIHRLLRLVFYILTR